MYVRGIEVLRDSRAVAAALQNEHVIGFDTETSGLSPWKNKLATMQFYGEETGVLALVQVNGVVPEEIKSLFTADKLFIGHNVVSFDIPFWKHTMYHGIMLSGMIQW
jgi:uncharacterized protein YprB with RNaseH-like and TPR domain